MLMRSLPWPLGPVAHRGLHDSARGIIENTPGAIAAALIHGFAIEVDLQAARDGMPVVFHDERLERLIAAEGLVAERSVDELQRLSYRNTADRIITFDTLLEMVAGRVPLYVEVKTTFGAPGAFERRIAAQARAYRGPLALMSFDPRALVAFRELAREIPRGLISYRWDDDWVPAMSRIRRQRLRHLADADRVLPSFVAYDVDDLPEPAPLALRRQRRCQLLTWTVRTPEQRARAARYADAMIFEGFLP
jgi:glycerophosphoryl diester phosphodiesterase